MRHKDEIVKRMRELESVMHKTPTFNKWRVRMEYQTLRWTLGLDVNPDKDSRYKPQRKIASKIIKNTQLAAI